MSEFVKLSILQQAGTSMLSQANHLFQTVLQLLIGGDNLWIIELEKRILSTNDGGL